MSHRELYCAMWVEIILFLCQATQTSWLIIAELGDYHPEEHAPGYLSRLQLIPGQTEDMEKKISELHKLHKYIVFFRRFQIIWIFPTNFSATYTSFLTGGSCHPMPSSTFWTTPSAWICMAWNYIRQGYASYINLNAENWIELHSNLNYWKTAWVFPLITIHSIF